jgi:hypothetical protein
MPVGARKPTDAHKFWTPITARDWLQFGYSYPECPISPLDTDGAKETFARKAADRVTALYGWMYVNSSNAGNRDAFLNINPNGQNLFAAHPTDGTPAWDPRSFVANPTKLTDAQPIRNFVNLAWYPRMKPGFVLDDSTLQEHLDRGSFIPLTPPPPSVVPPVFARSAVRRPVSAAARDGPRVPMSEFRLDPKLRAKFPTGTLAGDKKEQAPHVTPAPVVMAANPQQSTAQAATIGAAGPVASPAEATSAAPLLKETVTPDRTPQP